MRLLLLSIPVSLSSLSGPQPGWAHELKRGLY
jgi:hypothetical protein